MLPALAGAVVLALLWLLFYLCMRGFNSLGDAIGVAPASLWYAEDGHYSVSIFSDWRLFVAWASACSYFALGPLVALLLSRSRAAYIFSVGLLLGVITHGCLGILNLATYLVERATPPP